MSWEPEVEELERRRRLAAAMGGPDGIERQRRRGKLTVRERIAALADGGTFQEIGGLAGGAKYDGEKLTSFTPANMVIGTCSIDGRRVVVAGGDFTVRGGAADAAIGNKHGFANQLPLKWQLPYVRLLDATGGSVRTFEQIGRTYIPTNSGTYNVEELLCTAPVVALALGSVAGLPAVEVCLSHFSVMVKGISHLFAGGPPVVKAALGVDISKEELGDERTQVFEGGVVDNLAETEEEAFEMARRFLGYLPQNVWELPPRAEPIDDPGRRDEELLSVIPRERRRGYDPRAILEHVLDRDSVFELTPHYGKSRITALARVNGYPVGVMINNPMFLGGSMDVAAGTKVIRFIQLCDTFHLSDRESCAPARRSSVRPSRAEYPGSRSSFGSSMASPVSVTTARCGGSSSESPGRPRTGDRCTSRAAPPPPTVERSTPPRIPRRSVTRSSAASGPSPPRSGPPRPSTSRTSSIRARHVPSSASSSRWRSRC
jgi:acetyl-CoA carboxylase carboxyltransferase component